MTPLNSRRRIRNTSTTASPFIVSSTIGATMRQGPHQVAQKSTMTGMCAAMFEGWRGGGNRMDDIRPCSLTFVK